MKLFQWHFGFYLIPLAFLLPTDNAQAAFTCTTPTFNSANLGIVPLAKADNATITTRLTYSCTNTDSETRYVSICFGVDGGSVSGSTVSRRLMSNASGDKLPFNMTLINRGDAIWGRRNVGGTEFIDYKSVAPGTTETKFTDIKISLLPNNGNTKPGDYTAMFSGANTAITFVSTTSTNNQQCSSTSEGSARFSLTVTAKVEPECKVTTAGPLNFGNVLSTNTPTTISSSANLINVTCTNTTPYTIGLASLNNPNNNTGAGLMKSTGTNTDTVPYQLQSNINGKVWGNTATSTDVGNGVAGIGNGTVKGETVFATAPSTDVKPGSYSDTVTVNVNY